MKRNLPVFQGISFHKSPRGFLFTNPLEIAVLSVTKKIYTENPSQNQEYVSRITLRQTCFYLVCVWRVEEERLQKSLLEVEGREQEWQVRRDSYNVLPGDGESWW